jgi:hypothetical protein
VYFDPINNIKHFSASITCDLAPFSLANDGLPVALCTMQLALFISHHALVTTRESCFLQNAKSIFRHISTCVSKQLKLVAGPEYYYTPVV